MSRVAKSPIEIPADVTVEVNKGVVDVKGKKGSLSLNINSLVKVEKDSEQDNIYHIMPHVEDRVSWVQAGTTRALINNMIVGVHTGFDKTLLINGVGYRAQVQGKKITLTLGFSHPVEYTLPEGITAEAPNQTTLIISGVDKQTVGQVAANIRSYRKPEPYKGKGIRYKNEIIARKEAKKK